MSNMTEEDKLFSGLLKSSDVEAVKDMLSHFVKNDDFDKLFLVKHHMDYLIASSLMHGKLDEDNERYFNDVELQV